MKKKLINIVIIIVVLLTGILSVGCGSKEESATTVGTSSKTSTDAQTGDTAIDKAGDGLNKATRIRIGDQQFYFPVKIAEKKGFFAEEFGKDITVEVTGFVNGPAVMEAFTAGEIDFCSLGDMPTIQAKANNNKVKVISSLWDSPTGYSLVAGKNSGINKLEDIKGKKIAVSLGTNNHKLYLKYLQALGYSEDKVELVNLSAKDALTALASGQVDATIIGEPTLSQVIKDYGAKEIINSEGYDNVLTVIVGNSEFLSANPDLTKRFLKVIDKANKWAEENPKDAIGLVAEYTSVDYESIEKYFNTRKFEVSLKQDLRDALKDTIQFAYDQKTITEKVELDDLVEDSYVKALGLE
ncbi:MAG: ABC transporter substrate-binding protein [Ruminiclostridium sp.]